MKEQDLPWQSPRQLWTHRDSTGRIVALGHATLAASIKWALEHDTTFAPWQEGEYLAAA